MLPLRRPNSPGTIQLSNVDNFSAHNIEWISGKTATVTANPGTYLFNNVYTGLQTIMHTAISTLQDLFWGHIATEIRQ